MMTLMIMITNFSGKKKKKRKKNGEEIRVPEFGEGQE